MKPHFLAEKRVSPLVLLGLSLSIRQNLKFCCSFRIEMMLAWRFDWPACLRAFGNRPDQSPAVRT
jgi:hypothetical protein